MKLRLVIALAVLFFTGCAVVVVVPPKPEKQNPGRGLILPGRKVSCALLVRNQ